MSRSLPTAWLNGRFLPLEEARISPLDRGFLFGDAVYEVIPVYDGHAFRLEAHLGRLTYSLAETRIPDPLSREDWREMLAELVRRNGDGDQAVYLQVSRGADAGRDHRFPDPPPQPTCFAMASPLPSMPEHILRRGAHIRVYPDQRWQRCDIKATTLLANLLARQEAHESGADEALLERDGRLLEGSSTTFYLLHGTTLSTPPLDRRILPGITREVILELAAESGLDIRETELRREDLESTDECWLSSSGRELVPVTRVGLSADHEVTIGDGRPGPRWRELATRLHDLARGQGTPTLRKASVHE